MRKRSAIGVVVSVIVSAVVVFAIVFGCGFVISVASNRPLETGRERVNAQGINGESGYISVNGLNMYYEIHGTGSPLVLLHGALNTIDMSFGQLLPVLAETRQVIAVEQQGHGHTADIDRPLSYEQMANDTAALLSQIGIEEADILGFGMGGGIALEMAMRYPDLVHKLVIVSTPYNSAGIYPEVYESIASLTPEVFTGSGLPGTFFDVASPEEWPTLLAKVQQLDLHFEGWQTEDIQAIETPTLIIIGDSDDVRPEHAVEMFRLLGGGVDGDLDGLSASQLAVLPGTTHNRILAEHAEWLLPMITAFLDAPAPSNN